MFYFDNIDNKKVLKSDLIKNAHAFFTTRETIIKSKDPDFDNLITRNKQIIANYIGIYTQNLISPEQTHSANIQVATINKNEYPDTDALILTNKKQGIFLNFADCTPLIFYDEKQNIGAIAHAGWRGTAQKIGILTAEKLVKEYNSNPKDICTLIGPAISLCCYNVGEEVFEQLSKTVSDFEGLYKVKDENTFVDLKNINKRQLNEFGITKIDVCPYCTVCDNEYFFSYRKENATTNRHSAVLKLE